MKKKINKIQEFIRNNCLDFTGSGSELNGNCVILAGYACYLGLDWTDLNILVQEDKDLIDNAKSKFLVELERVFDCANRRMYGLYWHYPEAKKTYKF